MNCDGSYFFSVEYYFKDGTLKDALAFLLSLLLVSGAIKKNCKLCNMEADSEKAKNWTIFWNLFNQVLSKHTKEIQQAGV